MAKIILGDGLLGSEIHKQTDWRVLSRKKDGFDITNFDLEYSDSNFISQLYYGIDTIVDCIGYTNTYDKNKEKSMAVNYLGTMRLVDFCNRYQKKLVYISTDYIYGFSAPNASEEDVPVHARNWYSYSKLLADAHIQAVCKKYLIIRTSFKPTPFPYEKAIITQKGNFDYVDVIAGLIIKLIEKEATGVYNVGTDEKTIYDLAMRTKYVKRLNRLLDPSMPTDITMNTEKMEKFLNG